MGRFWQVIGQDVLCKWLVTGIVEAFASSECPVQSWKVVRGVDSTDQKWGVLPNQLRKLLLHRL